MKPALGLSLALIALPSFAEEEASTENLDTITVTASALKVETPLAETPRSVSVIDEEQLSVQQPQKLDEALRYQPGVMTQPYGSDNDTDWFKVRGFDAATYLDGNLLTTNGYYVWTLEPYGLEQVEVLKGPSAILYGEAPPGGVINAVSKRPGYTEGGEFKLQAGTNNQQQIGVDTTSFIDDDGDVRFRLVGMMSQRDGMLDDTDTDRVYLAPSLAWDISPDTSITFLASYKKDDGVPTNPFKPAYGTLIDTPNGKIDPSTNLGEPGYDENKNEQISLAYELEHHFNDVWSFKQNTRYAYTDLKLISTYANGSESSPDLTRGLVYRDGNTQNISTDNQLVAEYDIANTENLTLIGIDLQYYRNDGIGNYSFWNTMGSNIGNINIFNPIYDNYTPADPSQADDVTITKKQAGVYLQHQLIFNDRWVTKAGVRYDFVNVENDVHASVNSPNLNSDKVDESNVSFSGGLMYLSDYGISPYVSYSQSFEVLANIDSNTNSLYKPVEGEQTEVGIKYQPDFLNGYINIAYYDVSQTNSLVSSADGATQTQAGEKTSKGVEIETTIQATDDLLVRANYTYTDSTVVETEGAKAIQTPLIPKNMASAWLEYDFTSLGLDSFVLGAGARYMGSSSGHASDYYLSQNLLHVPSVTLFDAMARYDITPKWRAQVNVNNLTDKEYVSSCDYYCYYGEELTATATINYTW
ncbi:TonB-dependent siderophore receptor [Vibrio sp. CK2-1]|nr:TonB-dependent siderophore receptor [Vibrio sp. CK2-1]